MQHPFDLSFISFGEGRIRLMTGIYQEVESFRQGINGNFFLPNGKDASIDYFITDHRSDVRMILTEEEHWIFTNASMEGTVRDFENELYNNSIDATAVAKSEAPGWTSNGSNYISKLNNNQKIGPNQLLKVMAGDLLHTNVEYYYQQPTTNSSGSTVFADVLSMLAGTIAGPGGGTSSAIKNASTAITNNLAAGPAFSQVISPDITSPNGDKPKAYLNMVFFDERFNFVAENSSSVRVGAAGIANTLAILNIKAPKNGYCYIYISNESSENVFFDNLAVEHVKGRILEENHYYAYGLKIAAISSKAFNAAPNNYQYQGDYSEFDDDLGWNDFMLRSYDPQIGRFLQNDPYDQFASGYVGMGNDPANTVDKTGGIGEGLVAGSFSRVGEVQELSSVTVTAKKLSWLQKTAKHAGRLFKNARQAFSNAAWNAAGVTTAVTDNFTGGLINLRESFAPDADLDPTAANYYDAGLEGGDIVSIVAATMEGETGEGLFLGGGTLTVSSGGALSEVGIPAAVVGGGMMLHSAVFFGRAVHNLQTGSGKTKKATERKIVEDSQKEERYNGPKPKYQINQKHVKLRKGQDATPLPSDAEEVYKNAVPDDPIKPRHWYGKNKEGNIYRFSSSNDGNAHFSGRSDQGDGIQPSTYAKDRLSQIKN